MGTSLINQLQKQHETLLKEHNLKINLMGIANSRKMLTGNKPFPLEISRETLNMPGKKVISMFSSTILPDLI